MVIFVENGTGPVAERCGAQHGAFTLPVGPSKVNGEQMKWTEMLFSGG